MDAQATDQCNGARRLVGIWDLLDAMIVFRDPELLVARPKRARPIGLVRCVTLRMEAGGALFAAAHGDGMGCVWDSVREASNRNGGVANDDAD
jgi:hypothetical protein